MLRDLYEKQATAVGGVTGTVVEGEGFGRNMMEMREFVRAQRTYNVSLFFLSLLTSLSTYIALLDWRLIYSV
jgi:hypothetical protein